MIKPNFKLTTVNQDGNFAQIEIEPLEKGFGHTLGNALRRVLLTALEGAAATNVHVEGVNHQFTTLSGLQEDIVAFIINVKGVYFKLDTDGPATAKIDVKGKKEIKASDIECPAGVTVLNPDHVLGVLTSDKSKLKAQITINHGFGYVPAEENATQEVGVIPLDSVYTPVVAASYTVESTRVGRRTDLDKIVLKVETNGSLSPEEAVIQSADLLSSFFNHLVNPVFDEESAPALTLSPLMDQAVEELGLPTRITNSLKKGGFKKYSDFAAASKDDLLKIKNLGAKSVDDVIVSLRGKGIDVK